MNKIFIFSISFVCFHIACSENLAQRNSIEGMVWVKAGSFL
jgi:hypothetical protein